MSMQIVSLVQGSADWHAHRAKHFNASDAPAMMGCSSYKSRSELIKELATGLTGEVDAATQRRFDDGHRFEALARPLAEEIIGEDLSPCVGVNGKYSASFDGLTFMNDQAFEHKTLNKALRQALAEGDLPLQYRVQMEQQAMVSGCDRILFMASEWTGDGVLVEERHCWYEPDAELRAQIIAGWEQLEKDVAAYVPETVKPEAIGQAPDMLPTLRIEVQGAVTASNLDAFKVTALSAIRAVNTELVTDQDFADADKAVEWCEEVESRLASAKEHALAQTESIDHLFRTIDEISEEARQVRLKLAKLVKSEKESRKEQIVLQAKKDLDKHIGAMERRLEALDDRPCNFPVVAADFAGAVKGLKSLDSMRDKVAVALTSAKLEASQMADKLEANRKHLMQDDGDWIALFADFATVGTKAAEDFQALASLRIGNHKQAEAQRMEAQREKIRQEEAARLEREAAQAAEAERQRIQQQAQQEQAEIAQAQKAGELAQPVAQDLQGLVADKATEDLAGVDAKEAIATAQTSAAADSGALMTLGQLNTRLDGLGLGKISAATLEHHSIPFTKERAAVQITEANARRLMLLLSMGYRKFADDMQAVSA